MNVTKVAVLNCLETDQQNLKLELEASHRIFKQISQFQNLERLQEAEGA